MPKTLHSHLSLADLVRKLGASADGFNRACIHQGTPHLPSRDDIHDIIELLRSLLFPGYFGLSEVAPEYLHYRLGSLLEDAIKLLRAQIYSCLCFARRNEKRECDCELQADQFVSEFINRLPHIKHSLREDVRAAYEGDPACASEDEAIYCYPGIQAVTNYRIAHELSNLGIPLLPRIITEQAHSNTGIDLHPGATIGEGIFIDHGTGVVVGETSRLGRRVKIYQGVTLGAKSFPLDENGHPIKGVPRHPILEDEVIVYAGATILGHITIGKGSIIGGNVWLTQSVPPNSRVFQKTPRAEIVENGKDTVE
jgi:serine O-acetyltransferase